MQANTLGPETALDVARALSGYTMLKCLVVQVRCSNQTPAASLLRRYSLSTEVETVRCTGQQHWRSRRASVRGCARQLAVGEPLHRGERTDSYSIADRGAACVRVTDRVVWIVVLGKACNLGAAGISAFVEVLCTIPSAVGLYVAVRKRPHSSIVLTVLDRALYL